MSEASLPVAIPENNNLTLQQQSPFRKWAGLGVLSLGLAIIIIDTTLLNVSLSTIIRDLNTDLQSLQWVITAYALVLGAFTITGGRFGDLFGRRRMFMLGAIIFAIGSFLASISHSVPILLLGESIIEGLGAALMMPATASLVVANFTGKDRATAFGVWGGVAGASSALGPLLGGYLTTHYSWRWGFRINIVVAAVVVIGSLLLLKESRDERKPKLDWWGVLLSSLGLFALVFGIIESSTLGWWHAKKAFEISGQTLSLGSFSLVPISILIGLVLLALFIWWEKRLEALGKSPLVSMNLLKNRQFTSGVLTTSIITLGMTGMIFALPVFLQTVKKLDAFHTGLALVPMSLAMLIVAPLTGILSKKVAPKYFIQAGLIINIIAAFILRASINVDVPLSHLIPGLVIYGMGIGMVMAPISNLVLSAVPMQLAGEASGVNNTMRQVGGTLGAAIIGAAVLTSLTGHLVKGIEASQVIPPSSKSAIIQKVSDPNSNVGFALSNSLPQNAPPIVALEMQQLAKEAGAKATQDAYVYSALFGFLAFVVALFLPKTDVRHAGFEIPEHEEHSARKFVLAAILIALGVTGAVLLLKSSAKTIASTGFVNVGEIRSAFTPPPPNPPSPQIFPNDDAQVVQNDDAQVQGAHTSNIPISPRGPEVGAPAPQPTPQPQPQPQPQPAQIYQNPALGFQIQISELWQANTSDDHTIVFTNAQGVNISVQSYDATGQNLSLVQTQLEGSPSVSKITRTTFKGLPALSFVSSSGQGIAIIHNGKLFYIMGPNLNSEPVNTFSFL